MVGGPWLRVLEAYAVQALLRSPTFHRGVEKVAKNVHRIQHGLPHEEQGGTNLDGPSRSGFGKHFLDEMKTQLGRAEEQDANGPMRTKGVKDHSANARVVEDEDADSVWRNTRRQAEEKSNKEHRVVEPEETSDSAWLNAQNNTGKKQSAGFLSDYMDAIKEQIGNIKPPR